MIDEKHNSEMSDGFTDNGQTQWTELVLHNE